MVLICFNSTRIGFWSMGFIRLVEAYQALEPVSIMMQHLILSIYIMTTGYVTE